MAKRKGPTPKGGRRESAPALRPCGYCARKTPLSPSQYAAESGAYARFTHSPILGEFVSTCVLTDLTYRICRLIKAGVLPVPSALEWLPEDDHEAYEAWLAYTPPRTLGDRAYLSQPEPEVQRPKKY